MRAVSRLVSTPVLLVLCTPLALAAPPNTLPWRTVNAETLRHFTALLRIDTSNPPGNETAAAKYLAGVLEREGIPVKLLALDPARANLVARIQGDGSARPIAILGHTDVVGAQRSKWSVDPFAAVRRDGFVYARGAVDDKEIVTAGLMVMLHTHDGHRFPGRPPLGRDRGGVRAGRGRIGRGAGRQGALRSDHYSGESAAGSPADRPRTVRACFAALAEQRRGAPGGRRRQTGRLAHPDAAE